MANLRVDKITSTETFETTGSVQFDGNNDKLIVGSAGDFNYLHNGASSFTAEFWVYTQVANQRQVVFSTGGNSSSTGFVVRIMASGAAGSGNGYLVGAQTSKSSSGNYLYWDSESTELGANKWYHIATVYDHTDNTLKIYVDGKLTNSGLSRTQGTFGNHATGNSQEGIYIGEEAYNNSLDLQGFVSNLRIINGVKLYTKNFKIPMRELEVTPETTVLCCQSKTDELLEKTGKTIVMNGQAKACELTPGLLTPVPKSGAGSAITGSVEFSGTTDYLTVPNNTDLRLADSDFTIEFWATISKVDSSYTAFALFENSSALRSYILEVRSNGAVRFEWWYNGSSSNNITTGTGAIEVNEWYHYAVSRNGATLKLFINGIEVGSSDVGTNSFFNNTVTPFMIGGMFQSGVHTQKWQGNISNLRVVKGTALYTDDFIPPTRELKRVPGTVLLCCQDSNDPTQEVTRKTISLNGLFTYDTVVQSGITTTPTPSNFTPQVGDDRKITFEGVTRINSNAYFCFPTGDTASRETTGTYNAGTRAVYHSGESPTTSTFDTLEYLNIATLGSVNDFGNLTNQKLNQVACSSDTRGLFATGYTPSPAGGNNFIDYVTIMSIGNAQDFGDLSYVTYVPDACSNQIRGIIAGGAAAPNYSGQTNMDYVTIASRGNGEDFGDLSRARHSLSGLASPTRGVFAGGNASPTSNLNNIDYITIASTGNAQEFGDLPVGRAGCAGASSAIRGLFGGGYTATPAVRNIIDFITIATTGNVQDFGDLTVVRRFGGATSSATRGVFVAGFDPSATNVIDYVSIQTTGNAVDFGDTINETQSSACSNGHGGLG